MFEQDISVSHEVQLGADTAAPIQPGLLTHSRLTSFRSCPRKHFLRYELGLSAIKDDLPRRFGSAMHKLLECADKGIEADVVMADDYEIEMVMAVLDGHLRRNFEDEKYYTVIASEIPFDLQLINPETGRPSPVWRFCGVIDRIVKLADGRLAIMEYKTTSRDFAPGADYWNALHMDQQLSIYVIAARAMGYDVETVVYDVSRRPALRQREIPVIEDGAKVVIDINGDRVRTKDGKKWRETADAAMGYTTVTRPETPEEFGQRVRADIAERPEHYFARIEIARLDQDLDDCRAEIWQQQLAIREMQRTARKAGQRAWYRNPGSCYSPTGGTCDYLPICLMRDLESNTPAGFVRRQDVHPELSGAAGQ